MIFSERKKIRTLCINSGLPDPTRAYSQHRSNSKKRGIEFELSFDEWWGIWSTYYHLRGLGANGLCMARHGDCGGYVVGNIYLTTNLGNLLDYSRGSNARQRRVENYASRDHGGAWIKKGREQNMAFDRTERCNYAEALDDA
jgi:hypothetical protein